MSNDPTLGTLPKYGYDGLGGRVEREWFLNGWHSALEMAARLLQTANDETSRQCLAHSIRKLTPR